MLRLSLSRSNADPLRILCLGAHSDDIEIGAGGTILTLLHRYPGAHVHWIVFAATGVRANEARASAAEFLASAGEVRVEVLNFRDGFFPDQYATLKETFESLKMQFHPDLILSHTRGDHHQDHRVVADLTWNTFRDHFILGYEIMKYDPDLGNPNVFVPLEPGVAATKTDAIMEHFRSQRERRWFSRETFLAIMRVRGVQAAAPSGLAEGFYASKICL
jgi:LmbE family N-acetylglucosaminyl deacetylase